MVLRHVAGTVSTVQVPRWREPQGWVVWVLSVTYLLALLRFGWYPHDEGALGQSALRVLQGEVPHRDFADLYTGLLTYLHAAAFHFFGVSLLVPRLVLVLAFAIWVWLLYGIARELAGPWSAAGITLLAVVWSVPVYPAAMPSWYVLFLATAVAASALRAYRAEHVGWAMIAGACAALAVGFKVTGLFVLAGLLVAAPLSDRGASENRERTPWATAVLASWGLVPVLAAAWLLRPPAGPRQWLHLFLPVALVCGALVVRELTHPGGAKVRLLRALRLAFAVGAGAALTLAVLLGLYVALGGALHPLLQGVLVSPARRVEFAAKPPPGVRLTLTALLPLLALVAAPSLRNRAKPMAVVLCAVLLLAVALPLPLIPNGQRVAWAALRVLLPLAALGAALVTLRQPVSAERERKAVVLAAVTAFCGLSQYPFSTPVYFAYVAPLVVLAVAGVWPLLLPDRKAPALLLGGIALLFGLYYAPLVWQPVREGQSLSSELYRPLATPRRGIAVPAREADEYMRVTRLLDLHAGAGQVLAFPDAPEVYFLTDRRNPTRQLFDFLEDPDGRFAAMVARSRSPDVSVLVLTEGSDFSPPIPDDVRQEFAERFPGSERVGRFEVRWRNQEQEGR